LAVAHERRTGRRVLRDRVVVRHQRPGLVEVRRDVDAVQVRALSASARIRNAVDVDDVKLAVQRRGVLDDRVQVVMVLLRPDRRAELDAADRACCAKPGAVSLANVPGAPAAER